MSQVNLSLKLNKEPIVKVLIMPSKFVPFALAILFIIKLKFFRNKNIYEFIKKIFVRSILDSKKKLWK